ncbi:MAG: hypothetical protein ACNS62_06080 [Candidatus Cyclobacteriaceae bacterium M3_2C_046]
MKHVFIILLIWAGSACSSEDPVTIQMEDPISKKYGVDGFNVKYLSQISQLNDGMSGVNGISWQDLEPDPPVNGVHQYNIITKLNDLERELNKNNRQLQLNLRLSNEWALQRDPAIKVTNPGDGSRENGIKRVFPKHEEDLAALVEHILKSTPVAALQVGSEAENEWVDPDGFVRAMSIIYQAAKKIQPDIKIMAFGFNPSGSFLNQLNINSDLIRNKLNFTETVIEKGKNFYDVFSFHASREYEAIPPTVTWIINQMKLNGYTKPIWIDDMYSGPWLNYSDGTLAEKDLYLRLSQREPLAIQQFDSLQAAYLIKKLAASFASGVEKVFVSTDVDWEFYYIQNWRYAGLLTQEGNYKPAFFNLQTLIQKTDGFSKVEKLDNYLYKFSFRDQNEIFLAWREPNTDSVKLSAYLPFSSFRIINFIYHRGGKIKEILLKDISDYQLNHLPVLIEEPK